MKVETVDDTLERIRQRNGMRGGGGDCNACDYKGPRQEERMGE